MKMNTAEITAALLQGSINIDRMRHDTRQLVSMVIGFALRNINHGTEIDETFESPICKWQFRCKIGIQGYTRVDCWVRIGTNLRLGLAYIFDDGSSRQGLNDDLQIVYEKGLPVFVEGMMKKFPEISERWQFLIDASKVKFY